MILLALAATLATADPAGNPLAPFAYAAGLGTLYHNVVCSRDTYSPKCGCTMVYGILRSGDPAGTFEGPVMALDETKTTFVKGAFCEVRMGAPAAAKSAAM